MPPADKKYWDAVAGENLRLYRMIQAAERCQPLLSYTFTFCRQIIAAALITLDGRSLKYKKYLIQFSLFKAGLYWEKSQHGPKLRDAALNQSHAQKPSPFRRAWDQCIGICIKNIYEKINLNSS